jgi:ATP-binding cassette subfamily F protein 3
LLDKISFSLEENDKLGIVGVNGCGKSTLFKIIMGEYEPDSGNIFIAKDKTIGILTQDGAFDVSAGSTPLELMYSAFPALLAAEKRIAELEYLLKQFENLSHNQIYNSYATEYAELYDKYKQNGGLEYRSRCASILLKMGFDENAMHQNIETLSGGQRTRLALCHQLCREPDILLLDEPTNHLDIETLGALESFLAAYKKSVIVISHDRYFLDRVTNKTLVIEYTRARLYNSAYTKTLKQREADRLIAEKNYKDQQKEIARQEAYIKQQRQWNRERNIIAAESRQKMLDKMIKLERPKEAPRPIRLKFEQSINSGNDVLNVKNLTMRFGSNTLFSNINFSNIIKLLIA